MSGEQTIADNNPERTWQGPGIRLNEMKIGSLARHILAIWGAVSLIGLIALAALIGYGMVSGG